MKTTTPANDLRTVLGQLGAREFEIVALSMEPTRGLAAIAYAQERGVEHPVGYALKVFDDPNWQPRSKKKSAPVNDPVNVKCDTCGGDRFVFVTSNQSVLYGETVKPCPSCNASVDAGFWRADGSRFEVAR